MLEVLAPAGDEKSFFEAIRCGADAVYLGMPKFNARAKADNFSLDRLGELLKYAHLLGVKVYITLNTLVTDSELSSVIEMVGEVLKFGVDGFIVQDLGIVKVLSTVYPHITIHGSTQMGIHNVRGARVAKSLGLKRVVLSREVTIDDIREIRNNVDIDLEVFVQGAMCVCFSGNCYMSSLKCGASGNRGECKQLCRLKYNNNGNNAYYLSPRDMCMLDYLKELSDIGVSSIKIEGRLRRPGYVAITTSVYRDAVDQINLGQKVDTSVYSNTLSRVFTRGKFAPGYNDGNDVIDYNINNHIGIEIGVIKTISRFKDIYRLTIKPNSKKVQIVEGDGLKFKIDDEYVSMGVGNVEVCGDDYIVYGKNAPKVGTKVYKYVDFALENSVRDRKTLREINFSAEAYIGNAFRLTATSGEYSVSVQGAICETPKVRPITREVIEKQLSKVDPDIFKVGKIDIDMEEVFLPLSAINEARRDAIALLENKITHIDDFSSGVVPDVSYPKVISDSLAITDNISNFGTILQSYSRVIFAPKTYSLSTISSAIEEYSKYTDEKLILNMPIIAMHADLKVLDDIISVLGDKLTLFANNLYALEYAKLGIEVIAGFGLNVSNQYSATALQELGASAISSSIEKWCPTLNGTYKLCGGKRVLMTFAHCPYKTLQHNSCDKCSYNGDMHLSQGDNRYTIRRYRVANCYFELVDEKEYSGEKKSVFVDDLR